MFLQKQYIKEHLIKPLNTFCQKRFFPLLFIPISAIFLLLFSTTTSPLFISEGLDSAVFKSMGQAIADGKVIYRDIFDNKGPILYFINAIPFFFGKGGFCRLLLFILQVIGLSSSMYFMFRMARLFAGGLWSFISLLVTCLLYIVFFEGGNLCEEWMLYGLAPALYMATKWYIDLQKDKNNALCSRRIIRDGFFYGLVFAYTLFIRPNDAVAFIGGLLLSVSILTMASGGKWDNLLYLYLSVFVGFSIITIPIVAWFAYHHALVDLWNGMFGVNFGYVNGTALIFSLPKAKIPLMLCVGVMLVLTHCRGGWKLLILVGGPLLMMFLLIGHHLFLHYYIPFVPFIALGICFMAKVPHHVSAMSVLVLLLSQPEYPDGVDSPLLRMARHKIAAAFQSDCLTEKQLLNEGELLTAQIPDEERSKVWNDLSSDYSLFSIFPHNRIVQCNRVIFNFGDNVVFQQHILQKIEDANILPLWVISTKDQHDYYLYNNKSPYKEVLTTEHYSLFHLE